LYYTRLHFVVVSRYHSGSDIMANIYAAGAELGHVPH